MTARKLAKLPAAQAIFGAKAKNALSDEKAKRLEQRLRLLIGELDTVRVATQIGLPIQKGWRYAKPGDARAELHEICHRLIKLIEDYPT